MSTLLLSASKGLRHFTLANKTQFEKFLRHQTTAAVTKTKDLDPKNTKTDLNLTPSEVQWYPETKITTLSNGLRIASETNPMNNHTATIGVWINAGSRFETPKNNGSAHFLEHLAFKGTKNRTQNQLEVEIENIGGHLNAYTSREQTTYFAQVMKKDIPQAVDILSDILTNSKITSENVERERSVILREMEEVYKDTEEYVFDYLHDTAYLENPLGQTILGPKENINKLTNVDLKNYISTHYTTDRMVICGAGAVDHAQLVELVEKSFQKIPKAPMKPVKMVPAKYTGSDYRERQDKMPMAHIAIAYETCGWSDPDTCPLLFIHGLTGSWDQSQYHGEHSSSPLIAAFVAQKLGEKVMAFNTLYCDTGLFGVYVSAYEKRVMDSLHHVNHRIFNLAFTTEQEHIEEQRNQIISNAFIGLGSSSQVCEDIGRQVLVYGRRMHPVEFVARINAVDKYAVRNAARRFFHDKDHALAAVGPIIELPTYDNIRSHSYGRFR